MILGNRGTLLLPVLLLASLLLAGCGKTESPDAPSKTATEPTWEGRWFSERQFRQGKEVYMTHCASCHGARAQGTVDDWKQTRPDGTFPPPPLNGSAHAWHHPMEVLVRQINEGGIKLGGTMPPFREALSDHEVIASIAYFQAFWPEKTYRRWEEMNAQQ